MVAAVALSVVLVTGCGRSSTPTGTVTAASYVGQLCTSVVQWYRELSVHRAKLEGETGSTATPASSKKALESFLAVTITETEGVISALHGAGVPEVKNGSTVAMALVSAFETADSTLKALQPQVTAIPDADNATDQAAAAAASKHVTTAVEAIPLSFATLGGVTSPELDKATSESAACKSVGARPKAAT